jgi:hypothetical protein
MRPATSSAFQSATSTSSPIDYKKSFAEARNYWDYAHKILPAAKAGNADAQFYLSRLLERCNEDNKMYFERRGEKLTLDQGLQFAVERHLPIELAQSAFERCHEFHENNSEELGNASDWLAKATDAGQPIAEATMASKILFQEVTQNIAQTSGAPRASAIQIASSADPRELLRAAVESRDPEVLFSIGDAQGMLNPSSSDIATNRFAWWLVACQRGLDCSANATWVKNMCASDPQCASADSPSDLVRGLARDIWPEVQQRAQEISAKLDAGEWSELGLGS